MASTSDIKLRLADPSDYANLLPFVAQYHLFEGVETSGDMRHAALAQLLNNKELGNVWLIKNGGHSIGYVAACFGFSIELGGREAFIDEFYLIEAERGKGIGKVVLQEIIGLLEEQNIVAIHLEVDKENDHAQNLYAQLGFKPRDKYELLTLTLLKTQKTVHS